jgi:hypothetical protein
MKTDSHARERAFIMNPRPCCPTLTKTSYAADHQIAEARCPASARGQRRAYAEEGACVVSALLNASASGISCTPAVGPARLAHTGSGLADTVNHYPARATAHTGLRDHAVGLISWRERHCLCSGSEHQPEQSKHYYSDHCFLPVVQNSFLFGLLGIAQDRKFGVIN